MNSSFQGKTETGKDEWLTPPHITEELGPFDLDPCSPINRPWNTANVHYTVDDDGLNQNWSGGVWCNPPYGRVAANWLEKCSNHNNCIALIFARTETKMFFNHVWDSASAVLFIKGRLKFHHVDGSQGGTAGAPSVLVAYGENMATRLENCKIEGKFIKLK